MVHPDVSEDDDGGGDRENEREDTRRQGEEPAVPLWEGIVVVMDDTVEGDDAEGESQEGEQQGQPKEVMQVRGGSVTEVM